MVHSMVFNRTHNTFPLLHIRSRIAGKRKDATVQDTTQMDIATVHTDMMPTLFYMTHTEDGRICVLTSLRRKGSNQFIQSGGKLVPQFYVFA